MNYCPKFDAMWLDPAFAYLNHGKTKKSIMKNKRGHGFDILENKLTKYIKYLWGLLNKKKSVSFSLSQRIIASLIILLFCWGVITFSFAGLWGYIPPVKDGFLQNLENPIPITLDGPDATLDVSSDLSQLKFIPAQISEVVNNIKLRQFVHLGTFPDLSCMPRLSFC